MRTSTKIQRGLDVTASICMIVVSVVIITGGWARVPSVSVGSAGPPMEKITSDTLVDLSDIKASVGSDDARFVMVEFTDFQCPFCRKYSREIYPLLKHEFIDSGKIRYIVQNFPLTSIHPLAMFAAKTGQCAAKQGKYWEMHDWMFGNPEKLGEADLLTHAVSIGLNESLLHKCLTEDAEKALDSARTLARTFNIQGTPTFVFAEAQSDGKLRPVAVLKNSQQYANFQAALRELVKS